MEIISSVGKQVFKNNFIKTIKTYLNLLYFYKIIKKFDDDVEIFFQPFLNGDRPDIILLKRGIGATIIEVKDWDLRNYKIYLILFYFNSINLR